MILKRLFGTATLMFGGICLSFVFNGRDHSSIFDRTLDHFLKFDLPYYIGLLFYPALILFLGAVLILCPRKTRPTAFGNLLIFALVACFTACWHFWWWPTIEADNRRAYEKYRQEKGLPPESMRPSQYSSRTPAPVVAANRVIPGTSGSMVREKWGAPSKVEVLQESAPRTERWSYTFGEVLILENGIVKKVTDPFRE